MENLLSLLLAEDDDTLGFLLKEYLTMKGYRVDWAKDGAEALRLFGQATFDLVILDVMMPALDGFTVAELIRSRQAHQPIVFLTAKSMHKDVQRGFRAGADDFIKKPVNEEELLARIQAVLKRSSHSGKPVPIAQRAAFEIGRYLFDSQHRELMWEGETISLTEKESDLLRLFCENKNSLVYREAVLQQLWGRNDFLARKSMDVFVSRLRRYLSKDENIRLVNVHSSGFVLETHAPN